jgi:hypothetical protein
MAKSTEESTSKANIELHDIDLHKNDPQGLSERISEVAYQLFLKRGAGHGNDLGDWLEAEQTVLAQINQKTAIES